MACVGTEVIVTVTPVCGFSTVNARFEIDVVPAGIRAARLICVLIDAVPEQTLSSDARVQLELAPGNRGATCAAIAEVTVIPLIVVGATAVHAHVAGQFAEPLAEQLPVSRFDMLVVAVDAFQ